MSEQNSTQATLQLFSLLVDRDEYNVNGRTLETRYGLILETNPQGTIVAKLQDGAVQIPDAVYPQNVKEVGLKYRLFPEYRDGFLWYDSEWQSKINNEFMVDEDDLEARYGKAWFEDNYQPWVDRWNDSFKKNLDDQGDFHNPVFSTEREERAWVLEGMLFAVWLSLQPYVISVEYSPHGPDTTFRRDDLEDNMRSFLDVFDEHVELLNLAPPDRKT